MKNVVKILMEMKWFTVQLQMKKYPIPMQYT